MKQPSPLPQRLLTVKNSAAYLGRGVYGIRQLIWSGQLPIAQMEGKSF